MDGLVGYLRAKNAAKSPRRSTGSTAFEWSLLNMSILSLLSVSNLSSNKSISLAVTIFVRRARMSDDFDKISLPERLTHASWKARQSACNEIAAQFDRSEYEYASHLPTMVADANQISLESAMFALLKYLQTCPKPTIFVDSVYEKLSSTRVATRTACQEILNLYAKIFGADKIVDLLIAGFSNKNPKNVAAYIQGVTVVVTTFGIPPITPKPIVKTLGFLFDHRDKAVRAQVSLFSCRRRCYVLSFTD